VTRARAAARSCAVALLLAAGAARAHDPEGASLSLRELDGGRFLVRWYAGSQTLQEDLASAVVFPAPCRLQGAELACGTAGLVGTLDFPWIEGTLARVVVDVDWRDGTRLLRVASATSPSVRVYGARAVGWRALAPIVLDYTGFGVEHILTGFDHLLFVVALALLVRRRAALVATITAFTAAHSLSLAVTVLGLVHVPSAPVEASIALSIVLVCAECLHRVGEGELCSPEPVAGGAGPSQGPDQIGPSQARRAPWVVAFAFGLLHGLGFASALLELGVPEGHVPAALLCFNVGVEIGQLAVIAVVLLLRRLAARLRVERAWMRPGLVYAMGGLAAYWSIDRALAVLGLVGGQ
jgi:hydrogenase/urease accessory protein HupE